MHEHGKERRFAWLGGSDWLPETWQGRAIYSADLHSR